MDLQTYKYRRALWLKPTIHIIIGLVGIVGAASLLRARAATSLVSIETEQGRLSGNATVTIDTSASAQKAVQFKPSVSAPSSFSVSDVAVLADNLAGFWNNDYRCTDNPSMDTPGPDKRLRI